MKTPKTHLPDEELDEYEISPFVGVLLALGYTGLSLAVILIFSTDTSMATMKEIFLLGFI